ncbi:MAG: radical SAM protein [Candidatus Lokiarchaeota archaeon]|nr:radical SAM protein [Candidatus Lokiarchaeota archaeon]
MKVPRQVIENYVKTSYRVVGKNKHSSIKPCYWLEQKLLTGRPNRNCYKGYWGINSEQCIQNTPSFPFCTHNCVFCWRDTSCSLGSEFTVPPDEPDYLIEELIRHQINLIKHHYPLKKSLQNYQVCTDIVRFFIKELHSNNFSKKSAIPFSTIFKNVSFDSKSVVNKAVLLLKNCDVLKTDDLTTYYLSKRALSLLLEESGNVSQLMDVMVSNEDDIRKSYKNALHPNHAAISLDGEPTLYPYIGEFVHLFRKRGFTTFIVTNGTTPEVIQRLEQSNNLPSILYVTLPPPNKKDYLYIHRPKMPGTWEKIQKTLSMLKELPTRTVLRITSVSHLNIRDDLIDGYISSINQIRPNFLDIKGFTLEGASMSISDRLSSNKPGSYFFPEYNELSAFARNLAIKSGFPIIETHEGSRDILLAVNWSSTSSLKLQPNEI